MITSSKITGGDCYESAGRFITNAIFMNNAPNNLMLVHGIVSGQGDLSGVEFGHAWIEEGNMVLDYSNGKEIEMPKQLYYKIGKINPNKTYRYNVEETRKKILESGHWGPWDLKSKY